MRKIAIVLIVLLFLTAAAPAQTVSRLPGEAPFTLERGASFSASRGGRANAKPETEHEAAAVRITSDVRQALDLIRQNHAGRTEPKPIVKASINGMLAELDPHSNYLDADEFAELLGEHESEYSGTGSSISNFVRNGQIETYVVATHPSSAAARAGLQYGDRIVAIDGNSVSGLTVDVVRDKIRGPRGTSVRVTVERAASGKVEVLSLRRDRVSQPSIANFTIIDGGVGYIALTDGFTLTTATELNNTLRELHRRGMRSLVLDLRGNGGGILEQAIAVAERFLPAGSPIISQRGRHSFDDRSWTSGNADPEKLPLVVLVDRHTASASEIVAGALQDNDRAIIVGESTFGKGLVQNVVELPAGGGLTLTTARYYTPSGRSLQRAYESAGRYDYFQNRSDDKPSPESRTLTNRIVYGGQGIAPDEALPKRSFNPTRSMLIDPVFFFVRDRMAKSVTGASSITERDRVRQSIIFGNDPMHTGILDEFRSYVTDTNGWRINPRAIAAESRYIEEQLRYQLTLSAFGAETAELSTLKYDEAVAAAVAALPRAERLASEASRVRKTEAKGKQKSPPGRIPGGAR